MANRIRSVDAQDQAVAPSTALDPIDLPTNPISFLQFTVKALNNTVAPADYTFLARLMSFFASVRVEFKGHQILGGSLVDLVILNALLHGYVPVMGNVGNADNNVRFASFRLSFSRVPYWREEAFPGVRKGELQLRVESGAAVVGLDNFQIIVESEQLLGINPARFLKYTTQRATFSTTGQNDLNLPSGNPILGILFFGTSVPAGASFNSTLKRLKVLVDNVETDYSETNWETIHAELGARVMNHFGLQGHFHSVNAAAAGEEDTKQAELTAETVENYAYMEFDPLKDGSYALPPRPGGDRQIRVTADVADTVRMLPVELFTVSGLPGLASSPGGR